MITYDQFLAAAEVEDVRVLNLLSQGQPIQTPDPAEADAMFARIARLESAGLVLEATRRYRRVDGVLWQGFAAILDPAASVYLARAASERLTLSREPIPA